MTDKTEIPNGTDDPKELARLLMVSAARFAAAAMESYIASYPEQANLLAQSGGAFSVKVSEILSTNPRVALVNVIGEKEIEVAHVLLHQPVAPSPRGMH